MWISGPVFCSLVNQRLMTISGKTWSTQDLKIPNNTADNACNGQTTMGPSLLSYLTACWHPCLTLDAKVEFHQCLSSNGSKRRNFTTDHRSSNLFCIGVPVRTHRRLAARSIIALVRRVWGFLMVWPSSKMTRSHLILWRGESFWKENKWLHEQLYHYILKVAFITNFVKTL